MVDGFLVTTLLTLFASMKRPMLRSIFALIYLYESSAFVLPKRISSTVSSSNFPILSSTTPLSTEQDTSNQDDFFFATVTNTAPNPIQSQKRKLGSQELLMLPRQYKQDSNFPQMNHVVAVRLNQCPPPQHIQAAVNQLAAEHPLLQSRVEGDGEPDKRIDLFQMVRSGDPHPPTFATDPSLVPTVIVSNDDGDEDKQIWEDVFTRDLDNGGAWCNVTQGPLWKVQVFPAARVLLLSFNHAISDQTSANRIIDQLLQTVARIEAGEAIRDVPTKKIPRSLEESVLGTGRSFQDIQTEDVSLNTFQYVVGKAAEGFKDPVILPAAGNGKDDSSLLGALTIISGRTAGGDDTETRRSSVEFRSVSPQVTEQLLKRCRDNQVSISNALTAAVTYTATDFIGEDDRYYKVLQSLDMRRFGQDDPDTTLCMAGSHDLLHGPLKQGMGGALRSNPSQKRQKEFWSLAAEGKKQTKDFIDSNGPEQAVRVFDFAMTISDLNNLVHLTAQSKDTKGRAYSAGVTNVGVYERQKTFDGDSTLQVDHGSYHIEEVFFATPHVTSGCLFQVSAMTVGGSLQLTFNPVEPIVSKATNKAFADAFVELLEVMTQDPVPHESEKGILGAVPSGLLPKVTFGLGLIAVATHAGAWGSFFQSVMEMKANVADPADFWAALNFWIFFAVGHPILQPILWISDVLHGSPGPIIAGLVPLTFLLGNAAVLGLLAMSKEVRDAVNVAAVAAFFTYVGAGLDGTAGLGDFNLQLDDSYKGQVVKGCPAYDQVRQPSMDSFDISKYQGLWYEQKFHDWTQFKEVYDTTLGIKLTEGGQGWIDDFAVKGPAPDAAPLSWDKSPVANGAHYFLFGRVDPNDKPGILRESGFGVEFPNYIVDVKKDPQTGEYTEAIQFQCLERGGVRVFEGINFMSRNPTMTESEMADMHSRAEAAGMFPYGAGPEQMHTVGRRPVDAPRIDNNWQAMWRAIGVDKLLELLTTAIEDGGR